LKLELSITLQTFLRPLFHASQLENELFT